MCEATEFNKKFEEYKLLSELERRSTSIRHTTFTALISISFLLPGLSLEEGADKIKFITPLFETDASKIVFMLGFIFYCFTVLHYCWYHRYSHKYRRKLKILEEELGIEIYKLRTRPKMGKMKLHFDWALYIILAIYGFITYAFVGPQLWLSTVAFVVAAYVILAVLSIRRPDEPLEQ